MDRVSQGLILYISIYALKSYYIYPMEIAGAALALDSTSYS